MNIPCITAGCQTDVPPAVREVAHQLGREKCCTVKGAPPQSKLSGPIACFDIKSSKLLMGSYNGYGTVHVHKGDNGIRLIQSANKKDILPPPNDPRISTTFTVCDGCAQTLQEKHGFQVVEESEFFPPRTEEETRVIERIEEQENELRGIEQTYDEYQDKIDQYQEKLETLEETMARKRKHIEDEMTCFQKKRRGASGADAA